MSECKKHGDVITDAIDKSEDCPYCQIERLEKELAKTKSESFDDGWWTARKHFEKVLEEYKRIAEQAEYKLSEVEK